MTKAATLELEFITNMARIQGELSQIKRAVGQTMGEAVASYNSLVRSADRMTESLERQAATHGKTAEQIRQMDVAAKALALEEAGLVEQARKLVAANDALTEAQKKSAAANDNATASGHQYSMGQVVMQSAIRKTTDQFAAGANISTIFAEHIGTVVEVLQLYAQQSQQSHAASKTASEGLALVASNATATEEKVGGFKGTLSTAASFLAGPWGIAITAGVSVLAILGPKLFETGEAAKAAEKELKAFEERQSDMGRFIDATTGKLREQNRQLALIAKMTLPDQISSQAATTQGYVNMAFYTARQRLSGSPGNDSLLGRIQFNKAIQDAGSNAAVLARNLNEVAKHFPEFKGAADKVSAYAGESAEAAGKIRELQGHQRDLNTALSGGVVVTTAMIDRQVALATAHTAVAKAQQHLSDVKERAAAIDAMDPGPAKTAALAEYQRELTAASKAVNAAEDAQKAYRKELSAQAKAQRDAAREAKATAKVFAEMGKINLQPISEQMDKGIEKGWAEDWADTLKQIQEFRKGAADAASEQLQSNIEADHQRLAAFLEEVHRTSSDIADAWGNVGRSIGSALDVLSDYGQKQKELDQQKAAGTLKDADFVKQSADNQLNGLIGIAQATKGLFAEHSKGAKAAEAAEKALTVVQLARTAVAVAEGAANMFAVSGPAGFGLVAAMLAVMASLGFHGGGKSSAPTTNQGKGTVLGASDSGSDSIKRAIQDLGDVDTLVLAHSASMDASLKSIESHIGNLASLLVRTGNINGASAGIRTGFNSSVPSALLDAAIGGPLGLIAGPLIKKIPIVGSIVSGIEGVIKSLFGTKTSIVGSGLYGGSQSLSSVLSGGFDLQTFADIQKKKKFLGVTTGTSYSTQYGSADPQIGQQFTLILKSFDDAIISAAGPLGAATDDITKRLASFTVNLGKIDFTGLSSDEIEKRLENVLGAAADQMASTAFPGIEKWQQVGEGAFETLVRVASTVEQVTSDLKLLGTSTANLGIDAKMGLSGLFDSVDAFNSATNAYFDAFYSDAEKAAAKTSQLSQALAGLGIAMPDSIAAYRALVDAQDLTTDAGRSLWATLIQLAPAFASVTTAGQQATNAAAILREGQDIQKDIWQLQGNTVALRAAELAQLDPVNRALKEQYYALVDQQAAADAAAQAQEAAAQAAQEAAQAAQAAAQKTDALRQAWQSIGDTIEDEVKRIRGLTGNGGSQNYAALLSQFNAATDAARHGDQAAAKSLPELSKEMLDAAALVATSRQELDRVQAQTAASLEQTLAMINAATAASAAATTPVLGADTSASDNTAWWNSYAPAAPANETASLKAEVQGLRADLRSGLAAIAGHTKKTAKTLDDVTNGEQTINTALVA